MRELPLNAKISITRDGSPTLRLSHDGEEMHHSGGALSESFFIYDQALQEVLHRRWPVVVTSVGLGLGYNELIAIGRVRTHSNWKIVSYESQEWLRKGFVQALSGRETTIFTEVLQRVAARLEISARDLKAAAQRALKSGRLQLRGSFPGSLTPSRDCTCVFYDVFSKKTNAELWDEENLKLALTDLNSKYAVFATYAATGALNRTLRALGFRLLPKAGFCGKRQSTLAIRE